MSKNEFDIFINNILLFFKLIRQAGIPVGIDRSIIAVKAIQDTSLNSLDDLCEILLTILVTKKDHIGIFKNLFHLFWKQIKMPKDLAESDENSIKSHSKKTDKKRKKKRDNMQITPTTNTPNQINRSSNTPLLASTIASIQKKDFQELSQEELKIAKDIIAKMKLIDKPVKTRRWKKNPTGNRIDVKESIKKSIKTNGEIIRWNTTSKKTSEPTIIMLCDISGSMKTYSTILLHFLHAVVQKHTSVSAFLFGTNLTNVSRQLRHHDINLALEKISQLSLDWGSGTRIGFAISEFNLKWSRRVTTQNSTIILVSDGLDSDAGQDLKKPMERLKRSCKKIIWLNPLLRYDGFEPISSGSKIIRPFADVFLPVHNLKSLQSISDALIAKKIMGR